MYKQDVLKHFGNAANTARALGVSQACICQWPSVIPKKQAQRVEELSGGKLRVDEKIYTERKAKRKGTHGKGVNKLANGRYKRPD